MRKIFVLAIPVLVLGSIITLVFSPKTYALSYAVSNCGVVEGPITAIRNANVGFYTGKPWVFIYTDYPNGGTVWNANSIIASGSPLKLTLTGDVKKWTATSNFSSFTEVTGQSSPLEISLPIAGAQCHGGSVSYDTYWTANYYPLATWNDPSPTNPPPPPDPDPEPAPVANTNYFDQNFPKAAGAIIFGVFALWFIWATRFRGHHA